MTLRVGAGERVYRGFLRLYPADFRERFADDMVQLFHDKLRDARTGRAPGGTVAAWLRMLGDVAVTATAEHLRRDRTVAHSLTTAPTMQARALGIAGIVAGAAALAAFVIELPEELIAPRLIALLLGSMAIIVGVHRRQAARAPMLALSGALPAVLAVAWYLVMVVLSMLQSVPPFGGTFGLVFFWSGVALWSTMTLFAVVALRIGLVTRLGAFGIAIGSPLTLTGIDRLGLTSTIFGPLSQVGIVLVGIGWILLGVDLVWRRGRGVPA